MPKLSSLIEHIPDIFSEWLGHSVGGMKWGTYVKLRGKNLEQKAWNFLAERVSKEIAEEQVIPNKFLSFTEFPCEPGLVIFNIDRTFKELIKGKPKPAIATELVWDFFPSWSLKEIGKPMKTDLIYYDPDFKYLDKSSFRRHNSPCYKVKEIKVEMSGKSVRQLHDVEDLKDRIISISIFEDSIFEDSTIYVVDKVFYVDSYRLTVKIDGQVEGYTFDHGKYPVGFTVRKIKIGWSDFETRCIKHVSKKSKSIMNVSWIRRTRFSYLFRHSISNHAKYGAAAGDVDRYIPQPAPPDPDQIG